jgi:hypothetical protein
MLFPMRRNQSGSLLVWALFALVVLTGILFAGMDHLRASSVATETRFRAQGQALDLARAGIVDAYAWFRRQPSQPVTLFAPARNLAATPPINETDDPTIGLVRDFQISPGYWGRYEVRLFVDRNGNGRPDLGEGVFDATTLRGLAGAGTIWHIESHGFVYRRLNSSVAWNVDPNERVSGAVVATEVRRLSLVPPGAAAVCCARGDGVTVGNRGRIDGTTCAGAVFPTSTGSPTATGELSGAPPSGAVPGYDASWTAVFGVTADELKALASVRMPGTQALPNPFPEYGLVFVEGNLTVTGAAPLKGSGILVVDGNLTIAANSATYFTGLIYVTGNYVQSAPSAVRGSVIVGGTVNVTGAADFAELTYDHGVIDALLQEIGSYRISKAMHRLDADVIGGVR